MLVSVCNPSTQNAGLSLSIISCYLLDEEQCCLSKYQPSIQPARDVDSAQVKLGPARVAYDYACPLGDPGRYRLDAIRIDQTYPLVRGGSAAHASSYFGMLRPIRGVREMKIELEGRGDWARLASGTQGSLLRLSHHPVLAATPGAM